MARDEMIREQAIAWAVRVGDPAFDDWDGFTQWLEESPAHASAYDEATMAAVDAAEALPTLPHAENDDQPVYAVPRRRWVGGALAAVLTVMAGFGAWQMRGGTYAVETAPGETRMVALEGGGQIALAGDTRIVLDRNDPRVASLTRGQALFTIRHDPASPFRLTAGEDTLVDVGTVFEVKHTADRMTVAVSEGAVMFNPRHQHVLLSPGQMLSSPTGSDLYRVAPVPAGEVGEWRRGRLTFHDATLTDVAADLSRATGVAFSIRAPSADQRVSGSLLLAPVKADPRTVGPLLGVTVRYSGGAWELGAR